MHFKRSSALLLTLTLVAAASLVAIPAAAQQQISDADKKAARDLFNDGATLQAAGRYGEALDKFQKSIAVYPAPTTALRIAQCKASMNRLIEATEDYRSIINTALPPGSPAAYQQAKDQAAVELAALDPQVPRVKIVVMPERIAGLQVLVDGQPMNTALLGVARPIDPGTHRVTANAPGYAPGEATVVTVAKSLQIPEVRISLKLVENGVTYTDPNAGNTGNTGNTGSGNTGNTGTGTGTGGTTWNPPSGGGGGGSTWTPPSTVPKPQDTNLGVVVGADLGYAGLLGGGSGIDSFNDTERLSFSELYSGSAGFGINGGLRFARNFIITAQFRYDLMSKTTVANPTIGTGSYQVGGVLGWLGKSDGFGFYAEIGAFYKGVNYEYRVVSTNTGNILSGPTAVSSGGLDILLGIGLHFRGGPIHIIPKVNFGFGKFGTAVDQNNNVTELQGENLHASFFVGLTGYYDIPIGDK